MPSILRLTPSICLTPSIFPDKDGGPALDRRDAHPAEAEEERAQRLRGEQANAGTGIAHIEATVEPLGIEADERHQHLHDHHHQRDHANAVKDFKLGS